MKSFKCNYQVAAINAAKQTFSNCQISGCHFHFFRAKQIELNKISSRRKNLRLLTQLPLLPGNRIKEAWELILTTSISPDCKEIILFRKYFE